MFPNRRKKFPGGPEHHSDKPSTRPDHPKRPALKACFFRVVSLSAAVSFTLVTGALAGPSAAAGSTSASAELEKAAPEQDELWYQVLIADAPAGWMVTREIEQVDRLITETELRLELKRGGAAQTMQMQGRFEETLDHRPLLAISEQRLGSVPTKTTFTFEQDGVLVTTGAGERRVDPPEGQWLTPFAAAKEVEARLKALKGFDPATDEPISFKVRSMDPALGLQPITTTWTLVEHRAEIVMNGEAREVSRWRHTPSYAPSVQTIVDIDADGVQLRSVTPMMGAEMTVVLSSEQAVLGADPAQAEAPELLVPSFVFPDRAIERPRNLRRAQYLLSLDGEAPELPQTAVQRSETVDGGVRVWVDLESPAASGSTHSGNGGSLADAAIFLESTDYLRHDDPEIRRLLERLQKSDDWAANTQEGRAEALQSFVGKHLTEKNLDSILATASEAAATGAGDCTEHAMLLAALLRAEGIPSRVAAGLIYAESFADHESLFAYHMWTQAWLEGRWVDLDATLPGGVVFDAAHITLGVSALQDGSSALVDLASTGPLIGRVAIRIEDLGYEDDSD